MKNFVLKNKLWLGIALFILVLIVLLSTKKSAVQEDFIAVVKKGPFEVSVETTGELEAKNSVEIWGPMNLRRVRIYSDIKITSLIPEGTEVKKGDFVAQLDQSVVEERISNASLDLENDQLALNQAKIDTALELQQARNQLENLLSEKLERELELEKSKFEPPVTIRQAEVNLEKAKRNYEQSVQEYELKLNRARSKVRSSMIRMEEEQKDFDYLKQIKDEFTINAPDDGMVIYFRNWRGNSIQEGSMISPYDPIVATLPDMRTMVSKTFVNEVDIRKVNKDQPAEVTFDAFPEKKMQGVVINVANVGESLKNSDAKVFRVDIEIKGTDKDLRPAMTTGNRIITEYFEEALYLPIETVFTQGDSLNYVYRTYKFKTQKQEVLIGERNNSHVIITAGVKEDDQVLFIPPENTKEMEIELLDKNLLQASNAE